VYYISEKKVFNKNMKIEVPERAHQGLSDGIKMIFISLFPTELLSIKEISNRTIMYEVTPVGLMYGPGV